MTMATSRLKLASPALRLSQPPVFLAPALAELPASRQLAVSRFSTSPSHLRRDRNRSRGVSALRRTGPKHQLSVSKEPLPKPVLDPKRRTKLVADPDHGLWGFFPPERQALMTPEEMASHGRSWSAQELRQKSWEDLHALYWVCAREKNMIASQEMERERLKAGFGRFEAEKRMWTVRDTQKNIKFVLTERWYAYENALREVKKNPDLIADSENMWEDITDEDISGGDSESTQISATENPGPAAVPPEPESEPTKQART